MFYALAQDPPLVDAGRWRFDHVMQDIQTLSHRAKTGDLEFTAISVATYPLVADKYAITSCGASMGDGYGPMLVAREPMTLDDLKSEKAQDRRAGHPHQRLPQLPALPRQGGRGVRLRGRHVRRNPPGRARRTSRRRPAHPRGAADLQQDGPAPHRRPRHLVGRPDGPSPAAGLQLRPSRPRRSLRPRLHEGGDAGSARTASSTASTTATLPCGTA